MERKINNDNNEFVTFKQFENVITAKSIEAFKSIVTINKSTLKDSSQDSQYIFVKHKNNLLTFSQCQKQMRKEQTTQTANFLLSLKNSFLSPTNLKRILWTRRINIMKICQKPKRILRNYQKK